MTTQIITGQPAADYHAAPGLSSSYLRRVATSSPAHARLPVADGPALAIGTAVHALVLDGAELGDVVWVGEVSATTNLGRAVQALRSGSFDDGFAVAEGDSISKAFREASGNRVCLTASDAARARDIASEIGDRAIMTPEQADAVQRCAAAVRASSVGRLLELSVREASIYWEDPIAGPCKARPDAFFSDAGLLLDLKTTGREARPDVWGRTSVYSGSMYAVQAAHYLRALAAAGHPCHRMIWVVAETSEPYGVGLVEASDDVLTWGARMWETAVRAHQAWTPGDPVYPTEPIVVDLPRWLRDE